MARCTKLILRQDVKSFGLLLSISSHPLSVGGLTLLLSTSTKMGSFHEDKLNDSSNDRILKLRRIRNTIALDLLPWIYWLSASPQLRNLPSRCMPQSPSSTLPVELGSPDHADWRQCPTVLRQRAHPPPRTLDTMVQALQKFMSNRGSSSGLLATGALQNL